MNAIQLYLRFIGMSLRGQMQYRASFVLQALGHFGVTFIEFVAILALFQRFESLDGWSLPDVAVFYGFIGVSFAIADSVARGFDLFSNMVREGEFDRVLLRPRSTVLQLLGQELQLKRIGRLLPGIAVLLWGMHRLGLDWTAARAVLAIWIVAGNVALFVGLVIVQATMCFWTIETLEIMNSFTYGGSFAARYPISIYERWLREVFTYLVPIACTSYYPIVWFLDQPDPLHAPTWFQAAAPAAGFVFLALALGLWRFGVRHYRSTGS